MKKSKLMIYRRDAYFTQALPILVRCARHLVRSAEDQNELRHCREFWEVAYVIEGEGNLLLNELKYPVRPGFVMLMHPDDMTNLQSSVQIVSLQVLFKLEWIVSDLKRFDADPFFEVFRQRFDPERSVNHALLHVQTGTREIQRHLTAMLSEFRRNDSQSLELLRCMLLELLLRLSRLADRAWQKKRRDDAIRQIRQYLRENFAGKPDCAKLAAELGFSRNYLSDFYKRESGETISDTLKMLRLTAAARRLANSNLPVNEIAAKCGFPDPANFYRFFKRRFGVSPGEYRALRSTES